MAWGPPTNISRHGFVVGCFGEQYFIAGVGSATTWLVYLQYSFCSDIVNLQSCAISKTKKNLPRRVPWVDLHIYSVRSIAFHAKYTVEVFTSINFVDICSLLRHLFNDISVRLFNFFCSFKNWLKNNWVWKKVNINVISSLQDCQCKHFS